MRDLGIRRVGAGSGLADRVATCVERNDGARLRLFCFPFAGGGSWAYAAWARELPPDVRAQTELWTITLRGRDTRRLERPFTRLGPLVDELRDALAPQLSGPYVFFGHSMGALVAFELARQLSTGAATAPLHLIVSAHRAPQLPDRHPPVHALADAVLLAKLSKLGGTPKIALENPELMELLLPVFRADFEVCETYVYGGHEPLPCPVTAFGGVDDPEVSRDELAGWSALTQAGFALRMFPGGHFFLESARPLVLRVLARELREAVLRAPRPA